MKKSEKTTQYYILVHNCLLPNEQICNIIISANEDYWYSISSTLPSHVLDIVY